MVHVFKCFIKVIVFVLHQVLRPINEMSNSEKQEDIDHYRSQLIHLYNNITNSKNLIFIINQVSNIS